MKEIWEIYGEDPNPDLAGSHHPPLLAVVQGSEKNARKYAETLPDWKTWGKGGRVIAGRLPSVDVDDWEANKLKAFTKEKERLLHEHAELVEKMFVEGTEKPEKLEVVRQRLDEIYKVEATTNMCQCMGPTARYRKEEDIMEQETRLVIGPVSPATHSKILDSLPPGSIYLATEKVVFTVIPGEGIEVHHIDQGRTNSKPQE